MLRLSIHNIYTVLLTIISLFYYGMGKNFRFYKVGYVCKSLFHYMDGSCNQQPTNVNLTLLIFSNKEPCIEVNNIYYNIQ